MSNPVPEERTPSAQWYDDPSLRAHAMKVFRNAKTTGLRDAARRAGRRGKTGSEIMQDIREDLATGG